MNNVTTRFDVPDVYNLAVSAAVDGHAIIDTKGRKTAEGWRSWLITDNETYYHELRIRVKT